MSLLEMNAVYGGYGGVDILNGVDLRVDDGEIIVVIGANGGAVCPGSVTVSVLSTSET